MSSTGQTHDTTTATMHHPWFCPFCLFSTILTTLAVWFYELTALLSRWVDGRVVEPLRQQWRLARRRRRARANIARMSRELKRDLAHQEACEKAQEEIERQEMWLEGERLREFKEAWERKKELEGGESTGAEA
jgi:hypothetical protein